MSYGQHLRRYLDEHGISVRSLSRRLNPEKPEAARRQLNRIIKGREPRAATRERIADALDTTREAIEGSDEEDEDQMVDALLSRISDLTRDVQKLRRRRVAA